MKKLINSMLAAVLALTAGSVFAAFDAATYYVDAVNGSDANDGATPETAKATIQAMHDAAAANSTIYVAPGCYSNDVGRGANSTHWWGRSRLHLWKSVRIVSTDGADVTHIVGKLGPDGGLGSTTESDYDSACRCIDVELGESSANEIVVEGFTLRDGATRDLNNDFAGGGGAVLCTDGSTYSKSFALVDCVISNCYGATSLVAGGSLVRCRVENNTFYPNAGGGVMRSFTQCNVINSLYCNNRAVDRATRTFSNGTVYVYNTHFVNTTFANNRHTHWSAAPTWYYSCLFALSPFQATDGCSTGNGGAAENVVVDTVSTRCTLSPTTGDVRIRAGTGAATAGSVTRLAEETTFPLPSGVERYKDLYGNAIASDAASICAGAVQAVVTPAGGAVCGGSASVSFDGIDYPHVAEAWLYPSVYPTSVRLRAVTQSGQSFRRFNLSDSGYVEFVNEGKTQTGLRATRMPVRGEDGGWNTAWFIPPPSTDAALTVSADYVASANVRYCDPEADAASADGTEANPYRTIQTAIDASSTGDLVLLKPGVYAEGSGAVGSTMKARVAFGSKNILLRGIEGAEKTVIKGEADPDTGTFGANATMVAGMQGSAQIQGVTLTGGYSGASDDWGSDEGRGAIYSYGQDLEIADCIVTNNVGKNYAIGTAWFERCLIAGNTGGTGLAVNPVFVSCVVGDNTVTTDGKPYLGLWNSYVTKLYSTTFVGDGARAVWTPGGILADCAVNCVIDRGLGPATFSKGGVAGGVLHGFDASDSDFVAADPMLRDADKPDARLHVQSPARTAAKIPAAGALGEAWWYVCPMDFNGNPWTFDAEGRTTAGAVQETFSGGVYVMREDGVQVVSGGALGYNDLADGASLAIGFKAGSKLPVAGFAVSGVTNLFDQAGAAATLTVAASAGESVVVAPVYGSTWYVDAENGSDSNFGYNPATAFKTLATALSNENLVSGQKVVALPGTYREGTMIQDSSKSVRARGVVPAGVTLASRDGAAKTFIEGAKAETIDASSSADHQTVIATGMGKDAVRGVCLQANAAVEGFTITNCFTRGANDAGDGLHGDSDGCGAGVCAVNASGVARNCVFAGNAAFRGGGVWLGTAIDCVFDGNTALYGGGATSDANQYGCLSKNNVCVTDSGRGGFFYYGVVDSCTVLDSISGANNLTANSTVNTLVLGKLGNWDWMPGSTNYAHCCFANDVEGNIQYAEVYRTAILAGDGNVIASSAAFPVDDEGRPRVGSAAVDAADVALSSNVGDVDLLGGQRVYNGARDVGALEADWRATYGSDVSRRLDVSFASPEVVETEDHQVRFTEGTSLEATLNKLAGAAKFLVRATVSGTGTLSILVNGEVAKTIAQGDAETTLTLANPATDKLAFAYAGDGYADLGKMTLDSGLLLIIR